MQVQCATCKKEFSSEPFDEYYAHIVGGADRFICSDCKLPDPPSLHLMPDAEQLAFSPRTIARVIAIALEHDIHLHPDHWTVGTTIQIRKPGSEETTIVRVLTTKGRPGEMTALEAYPNNPTLRGKMELFS